VSTIARAAVAAATLLLVCAAPAHAVRCEDVFSKIRQAEPLAPFVVGDSVTVPAGEYLGEMGLAVDAVACRTFAQGLDVMAGRRLPDLVVMALGTNGGVSGAELDAALELVGPFARLMLVLPKDLGGKVDPDVRLMRAFEQAHPDQVTTLDWPAFSAGHDDWFAPDRLHITTAGAQGFAQMITEAVEFAPPETIEPPPLPRQPRRAEPAPEPPLAELWPALGRALASIVAPGLRLLADALGDPGPTAPTDL
jgi:hypothetical protein